MSGTLRARTFALVAAITAMLAAGVPNASGSDEGGSGELVRAAGQEASVVEVLLPGADDLDRLVGTGVDLDHNVARTADGIVAHAVVTPGQASALEALGFELGDVVWSQDTAEARLAEREATIAEHVEANEAFEAAAYDEATHRTRMAESPRGISPG